MTLAETAVAYARMGLCVFPLRPKSKKPYGRTNGLKGASNDPELVAAWWAGKAPLPLKPESEEKDRRPVYASRDANIGIATGAVSGLWVFDLDGPTAEIGLEALTAVHGQLPSTVEQKTGQGRHMLFAWNPAFELHNSASKIGKDIDVRGDGGYIVAPPSIHPGDEKKGIPPGRVYAWNAGASPFDRPLAAAPEWLLVAAMPAAEPERPVAPSKPRVVIEGRATRFGEATLNTNCARIAATPPGQQQDALFKRSCQIGGYVAGGEIEHGYAREALIDAGLRMVAGKKAWQRKDVESHVDRGLLHGGFHPNTAPERPAFVPAHRAPSRPAPSPAAAAIDIRSARALWDAARPADCGLFRSWLGMRGLDAYALPGALANLRAYQRAPIGDGTGPAILVPLSDGDLDCHAPDALAILPLDPRSDGLSDFVGDPACRVAVLVPWGAGGDVVVTTDFQDAWALGSNAAESEHAMGVVIAPLRTTLAGAALGDRWGRVDPRMPSLDPDQPPWTAKGVDTAYIAIRGDLENPPLRARKAWGGTARVNLQGEEAARFYGGLAEQGWRKAGANLVRIMRPRDGAAGFNAGRSGRGA